MTNLENNPRDFAREPYPVSMRALTQRINRRLKRQDQVLKAARGARARVELGDYYIRDSRVPYFEVGDSWFIRGHVDPEALGRELGVLQPYEALVDNER